MRARLTFGLIAAAVVAALVAWGFYPTGSAKPTAASHPTSSKSATPVVTASGSASASASASAGTGPPGQGTGWRLKLDASFSGSRLDRAQWDTCFPWALVRAGCSDFASNGALREYEWYLPSQVRVRNGSLQLIAQRTPTTGRTPKGPHLYDCRSGMVSSYHSFNFEYGYVQIVAQIPAGAGLWPALWLAASNKKWPPEIDILEHWGPRAGSAQAGPSAPGRNAEVFHPLGAPQHLYHFAMPIGGLHTFGLLWTPNVLTWYIDGAKALTWQYFIPHQSMYLLANVAEFDSPTSTSGCDGTMSIQSVKVWQRR